MPAREDPEPHTTRRWTTGAVRDAALACLDRGWSVLPLHSVSGGSCSCRSRSCAAPGKHPRVRWEDLTERPAQRREIDRWWHRWPSANIGVVTGAVSGVVVVDVDPRNGGEDSLFELEGRHGDLPCTVEAQSGGGGRHFYFRHPGGLVVSGPIGPGVDVKGDGGIVVCPPSRHESGRAYLWVPGRTPIDVPLADPPEWVLEMCAPTGVTEPRRSRSSRGPRRTVTERTTTERDEFAGLWAQFGIRLVPGDRYYLCPFHPDHRPSLHVDAEGCRFYCFGCGAGGGLGRLRRLAGPSNAPAPVATARVDRAARSVEPPRVTLPGEVPLGVVGDSAFQDALLELSGGRRSYGGARVKTVAQLVPEPDNPFDPEAIQVVISRRVIGYLPRADAARLNRRVSETIRSMGEATCSATIIGGWEREHGDLGLFGVILDLPRRDEGAQAESAPSPASAAWS